MTSSALTMDDMASVGLGELNMDEITGIDAGADVDVVRGEEGQEIDLSDLTKSSESAPIIKVLNLILIEALKAGASDIHVEPYEKEFRVRFRVDGILHDIMALPMRSPRPAHLPAEDHGQARHLREAPAPGRPDQDPPARRGALARPRSAGLERPRRHFGEKVVMRLLDKSKLRST